MKTPTFKMFKEQSRMILPLLCMSIILVTSCNKDDDTNSSENSISEEEAAEVIAMAVSPETSGLVEQTNEALIILEGSSSDYSRNTSDFDYVCGENYATSFTRNFENGTYSYNAEYIWNWVVNCDGENPTDFNFNLNGENSYTSPRMSSNDSNEASLSISALDETESEYVINQTYSRSGSQESFVRNQNNFTSTLSFTTSNLKILKANHNVTSGTMTVVFSGQVSNGNTYEYSGELVFNGNQTATLTLGSGNTYTIAW